MQVPNVVSVDEIDSVCCKISTMDIDDYWVSQGNDNLLTKIQSGIPVRMNSHTKVEDHDCYSNEADIKFNLSPLIVE